MQVRCRHCNRPYALTKDDVHAFLDSIQADGLKYQDSHCPHCGKPNRHSKKELLTGAPGWKAKEAG